MTWREDPNPIGAVNENAGRTPPYPEWPIASRHTFAPQGKAATGIAKSHSVKPWVLRGSL